MQPYTGP
jgi:hypothetical protein